MSTWEFDWYNKNVKQELGKFKSTAEKLEFIFKEKEHFRTLFRSKDADVVLAMFDDLVESIKIKDQFPKPPANNKIFALSQKEISEILYDGLDYTPATRAQFYINKAIEMGYKPQSLLTELNSAYKTIKSYVFTPNTKEWEINEVTGKRDNPKQTINLSIVTGGRQSGFITYKTIDKLFIPTFHQMQYLIQNTYNSKISPLINPTPPPMGYVQLINIIPSSLSTLPPIAKVFFIHYQCDKFEEGDHITSLCVYDNIDIKIFKNDEVKAIEAYCQKVDELSSKGLIPVHWDQNSPHFGIDHIKERYKILTGNDINILYPGSLNLADYLKFKYGENYVPHRRLDNLARLNNFSGIYETENGNKTFPRDRILLISKIYFNELKETLKTTINQKEMSSDDISIDLADENTFESENQKRKNVSKISAKRKNKLLAEVQRIKLNFKSIESELEKLTSINERLEYWNNIFIENIVNPSVSQEDQKRIIIELFGENYQLLTWIMIPKELYIKFFEPYEKTPEYTYWFLIRNANMYFKSFREVNEIKEKVGSPISELFIEGELKHLNNFEKKAAQLLVDKKIDIYNLKPDLKYTDEIEFLRFKSNYYQTHVCSDVHNLGSNTVAKYALHILYKEFLLKQQSKSTPPEQQNIINTIPPTILPSIVRPDTIQSKLTLNQYKEKLDFTLGYYEAFFLIVNAIKLHDTNMLIDCIKNIKQKKSEVFGNANLLTEQVHFDLTANEVAIFYKYGFKKLEQIFDSFNLVSEGLVTSFDDVSYSRTIHDLWHKHNNIGDFIIIYSGYQDGFIKDLYSSLLRTLSQFKEDFTKSYSISSNDNSTPDILEAIQDKHPKANFAKSAPSIPDLSDTKQITMQILDIFDRFDNFNFIIEDGKSKIIDLEELTFSLYNQISIFEKQLMGLHLVGNESILSNVKKELLKKKDNLDGIDFGISLSIPGAENTKALIEPESVKLVNQIKLKYLNQLVQFIDNLSPIRDNSVRQKNKKINLTKPFFVYILHSNNIQIAKSLKSSFTGKKGKTIRLMIDVLANQTEPLINYENRQRKEIYEAMKLFFNWDIGTYQSIWDYKRENDLIDYKAVEAIVLQVLTSIKNDK
jgi:hypothetical protein